MAHVGVIAPRTGRTIEYDSATMEITNHDDLGDLIREPARPQHPADLRCECPEDHQRFVALVEQASQSGHCLRQASIPDRIGEREHPLVG